MLNLVGWQVSANQNLLWKIKRNGTVIATFSKRNDFNSNPDSFIGTIFAPITAGQSINLYAASPNGNTNLIFDVNTMNCTVLVKKII